LTATPALKPAAIQGRSGVGTSSTDGNIGVHGISDAQAGVLGQYQGVAQVTQNLQINDTAGLLQAGVIGASDKGLGVVAASRNQTGLYASSSGALGYSIAASRGTHDAAGNLTGLNLAPLYLEPSTEAGPPTSNGHRRGEVHVDANGKVWVCASDGSATAQPPGATSPLELRKPAAIGIPSSGAFYQLSNLTFLANPIRILGPYNTVNSEFPTIVGNASPSYFKIEGNWLNKPPNLGQVSATIPSNALGIIGTISAFAAAGVGYLTIFPADAPTLPVVATLLYAGGGSFANTSVTLKLGPIPAGQKDAGKTGIAVFVLTTCQIAFDVVGYVI